MRTNHKGRAELENFMGLEDNTIPGYKFYRPLYRDFATTAHARLMKFTRRKNRNLNRQHDESGVKEGIVCDFNYSVRTVHRDHVNKLEYETTRNVEENF